MAEVIRGILVSREELLEFVLTDPQLREINLRSGKTEAELKSKINWVTFPEYTGHPIVWTWPHCTHHFILGYSIKDRSDEDTCRRLKRPLKSIHTFIIVGGCPYC